MKNIIVVSCLCCVVFGFSQRKPKIKGNRAVTEVSDALPAFNALELNDDIDIRLRKSAAEGYQIIADDNLIDILKFEVKDSTLIISSFYTVTSKKKLEITIDYKELSQVIQRAGTIEADDFLGVDTFYLEVSGEAELQAKTKAFFTELKLGESSFVDLNMDSDSLVVRMNGKSDAKLYMQTATASVELAGNANATFQGTTENLNLNITDKSRYIGDDMQSQNAEVTASLEAIARLLVTDELNLRASGTTKTYFYGTAKINLYQFEEESQLFKKEN